ncbi:hypothetical protein [Streptococcus pseudopneumoniae]|jgi:hypothetical protein|uniref:hypothetical protein n=1 Tax=Streptococcus pseudopneumoniae TaxID=257758 RepID=UPI00066CD6C4|nr:hypothetical protein [Streptococcus pseudopneumoniae]
MDRKEYRTTPDFLKALDIVKSFVSDALNGDISMLKDEDITRLINRISNRKKRNLYFGSIADPDMYYITQSIYILIWGHVFDLTFEKLGSWGRVEHPFRGDTMNSFNSVFGKEYLIAKRYKLNKNLLKNIEEYLSLYHSIGNFIVIPNKLNLNRQRANYYTLQDYFDSFLGALFQYKYQDIETEYRIFSEVLHSSLIENTIFNKIEFKKYISDFFLESYVEDGKPFNVFDIPLEIRRKEYIGRNRRSRSDFITRDEYIDMASKYYNKSKEIISYRAECIVDVLKNEIENS